MDVPEWRRGSGPQNGDHENNARQSFTIPVPALTFPLDQGAVELRYRIPTLCARANHELPLILDRYGLRNENSVLVRSQSRRVILEAVRVREKRDALFWPLTPGSSYPAAFWRDIKGEALGWILA